MTEIEQIEARLAEIEKVIASAAWSAHMSAAHYRPTPVAVYEERSRLRVRLQELRDRA